MWHGRAHLRSAERRDMLVPRTRTELGQRSFSVAAPTVWNSLPAHLRSTLIGRRHFRDVLKSHLFADAYFWSFENIRYKSVMYLLTYLRTYILFKATTLKDMPESTRICRFQISKKCGKGSDKIPKYWRFCSLIFYGTRTMRTVLRSSQQRMALYRTLTVRCR